MDERRRRPQRRPAPRRVGQPNVLSNQAIPNQLSTMAGAAKGATGAARPALGATTPPMPARRAVATTARQAGDNDAGASEPGERRIRVPSVGTIIFVGFLALTVARFVGQSLPIGGSTPSPTAAPQGQATPLASNGFAPGSVWFGKSLSDDCRLSDQASIFTGPVPVWWRAELTVVLGADDGVLVLTYRDGTQIDREEIPPDPAFSAWDILCASHPVPDDLAGGYRVEVWRADNSKRLATGVFVRR